MGAWDHFYNDSAFDQAISTHYVNLPHWIPLDADGMRQLAISRFDAVEAQHSGWRWLSPEDGQLESKLHDYARTYLTWISEQA